MNRFNLQKWADVLCGETVFIIGNGPSLLEEDMGLLDGRFSIGINRCFRLLDPTILIWQDREMYANNGIDDIRKTKAIKVCSEHIDDHKEFSNFRISKGNFSFNIKSDRLQGLGCTGALAVQLAVSMGAGKIVLLGCDGKYGKHTDFYGNNPDHKPHTLTNFSRAYRFLKDRCPVEIVNCCANDLWKRSDLKEFVSSMESPKRTRIQWMSAFLSAEASS
jgi:hypothetical protein